MMVLALAFLIDFLAGDPPNRFHPVAWMGSSIAWYRRTMNHSGKARRFLAGLLLVVLGSTIVATVGVVLQQICQQCPLAVSVPIQAVILKCTFSARSLARAATSVADALNAGDLPLAREQVAYHLVSRDVSSLDASDLSAATIESVAENTSDSIVAPLLFFAIAGLPGALVYRFVNTCDAMVGYRTEELEWFGKPAARFDDLLNLLPARLTAFFMLIAGVCIGNANGFRGACRVWWRDHALTASPNAGHPMSAASGVLGVQLEKQGHYRLGSDLPRPLASEISRAIQLLWTTSIVSLVVLSVVIWMRGLLKL